MQQADLQFVQAMVTQLDESIKRLAQEEIIISGYIATERIEELREYWNQEIDEEETAELKYTFDHWDKMLIFNWSRMQRAHDTRAKAGQTLMKQHEL